MNCAETLICEPTGTRALGVSVSARESVSAGRAVAEVERAPSLRQLREENGQATALPVHSRTRELQPVTHLLELEDLVEWAQDRGSVPVQTLGQAQGRA